jgi:OOP family OmpA-OmpF porin
MGIFANAGMTMPVGPEFTGNAENKELVLGGGIRYGLSENWGIGLSYDDVSVTDGAQFRPISVIGTYMFSPECRLTPIVYAGLGFAATGKNHDYANLSGKLSGGLEYFLTPDWSLSGLLSYHLMSKTGDSPEVLQAGTAALQLTWFFSVAQAQKAIVESKPVVETKAAVQEMVTEQKQAVEPVQEEVQQVIAEDPLQQKPEVGKPVSVQINILFDTGKAVVKTQYYAEVQKIADFMKKYPDTTTEIQGHSDNTGSTALNISLSQQRADSVRKVLIEQFSIEENRLTAKGYGPAQPIDTNDTAEGRQRNRRVMASISAIEK